MSLKIEAGKYYRTRYGRKVGPMVCRRDALREDIGRWCVKLGDGECWSDSGKANSGYDLIAEWRDQPTQTVTTNGRHYDLTKLETPFGLLPRPVKEALKAWPHGFEIYNSDETGSRGAWVNAPHTIWDWDVIRANPAPKETRVKCYRSAPVVPFDEYGTCIKNPDGSINWDTWEPEV